MSIPVQRMGRCQTFRETKISINVCLLQFAELFACVTFRISTVAHKGDATFLIWIYRAIIFSLPLM